jgi:hypothetical protein
MALIVVERALSRDGYHLLDVGARLCVVCFCGVLPHRRNGTQHECRQSLNIREDASSTRGSLDLSKFRESSEWGLASRTLGKAYCEYALFPKFLCHKCRA